MILQTAGRGADSPVDANSVSLLCRSVEQKKKRRLRRAFSLVGGVIEKIDDYMFSLPFTRLGKKFSLPGRDKLAKNRISNQFFFSAAPAAGYLRPLRLHPR